MATDKQIEEIDRLLLRKKVEWPKVKHDDRVDALAYATQFFGYHVIKPEATVGIFDANV